MAKGLKTGGRVKGSLNKLTLDYKAMLNAVSCNPFQIMSDLALDSEIQPDIRLKAAIELARFMLPPAKAIDDDKPDSAVQTVKVEFVGVTGLSDSELDRVIAGG